MTPQFSKKRPFLLLLAVAGVIAVLTAATATRADRSTPFVEGKNRVGDRAKEHGYVVSLGDKELKTFVVLVTTDTEEFVAIRATAAAGVVKPELLGRPVLIDAEILTSEKGREGACATLKVHGVELPPEKTS